MVLFFLVFTDAKEPDKYQLPAPHLFEDKENRANNSKLRDCHLCEFKCYREETLKRHIFYIHKEERKEQFHNEKPLKCSHCNYKTKQKNKLQKHLIVHSKEKAFKCIYCNFKCKSEYELQSHLAVHSEERPFKCTHCDHRCKRKGDLQKHLFVHSKKKPFKCTYCDFRFKNNAYLKAHSLVHHKKKITKYQDLKNDLRETWNAREADIIPVVVGATGIVKSNLVTYLNGIPENPAFQKVQESAVTGTVLILKRALGHHSR